MKIQTSTGYVILKDFLTRKAAREYSAELFKNNDIKNFQTDSETDSPKLNLTLTQFAAAGEALVLALVEKVALVSESGNETEIKPDKAWLDNLPEKDFKAIEPEALRIMREASSEAKK